MKKLFFLALATMSLSSMAFAERSAICKVPEVGAGGLYVTTTSTCPDFFETKPGVFSRGRRICGHAMTTRKLLFSSFDEIQKVVSLVESGVELCFIGTERAGGDYEVLDVVRKQNLRVE